VAHQEGAAQVDADHLIEHLDRDLVDHVAVEPLGRGGVVDQDVEPAELGERRLDHRLRVVLVADVAEHRERPAAARLDLGYDRVESVP
jgi:hypothetical protein